MALEKCGIETNQQRRELKEHGTSLFPIACYDDSLTEDATLWHWHDELEVICVETGAAIVSVDGEKHRIGQGDGCLVNAGALHKVWCADKANCRLHSAVFHPRLVGGGIDSIFWQGYLQPLLSDASRRYIPFDHSVLWAQEAVQFIERAWQSCVLEPPGFEFQAREALSQIIYLLTCHVPTMPKPPAEKALRNGERIKVMLQYIEEHYEETLHVARIAQSAAVSESECLRCFRSMIGTTPMRYVTQLRIQKASEYLVNTDQKIANIGALCGFQEMSYFAKIFKELKGKSPSEYREYSQRQRKSAPATGDPD